ncbi:MAG: histidine phosphatase family protein, partial [Gammaproteobacteria bacterium]|nr:histidine phosphatase family protein [Gammaproteobacteria bacterium]
DWNSAVDSDFQRPLSKRGTRDAPRVGQWLNDQRLLPDFVISSPATRARQTTCNVCNMTGIPESDINWEARIYEAVPGMLITVLSACPQVRLVLLVGHNPGLELLLAYLCGSTLEQPPDGKLMPTATLARIGMPPDWRALQPNTGRLISLTRPASMDIGG